MEANRAVTWPRSLLALLAVFALVVIAAPVAWAEHDDGAAHVVECEGEIDEDGDLVVRPGDEVVCVAYGLDPAEAAPDVQWYVDIWGWTWEDEEFEAEDWDGEDDRRAEEDGTMEFSFTAPEEIYFGVFSGEVFQGDEYDEEFFGFVIAPEGEMVCEPDPVRQGGTVTCSAFGMNPGDDFRWQVWFFSEDEEFFEDETEDFGADIEGEGTADEEGTGTFSFEVPTDRDIDEYFAAAWHEPDYLAFFEGTVLPAEEEEEHAEPTAEPTPVQPPSRVETGGGGTAPSGLLGLVVLGALLAAGALGVRRPTVRG
jgi:hypothetical protein